MRINPLFEVHTKLYAVFGLDDGKSYYYDASTPYEAMAKHLYFLNTRAKDKTATINKTESGLHLYTIHNGKYYAIRNNIITENLKHFRQKTGGLHERKTYSVSSIGDGY